MAKPRRKLSDLVAEETSKPQDGNFGSSENTEFRVSDVPKIESPEVTNFPTPKDTKSDISHTMSKESTQASVVTMAESAENPVAAEEAELQTSEVPRYLQLERKDTRLRQEQIDELTALARKLHRQRGKKGERLTDNTLIRIAVDLLLSQADRLHGDTEEELKKSVGLEVTD